MSDSMSITTDSDISSALKVAVQSQTPDSLYSTDEYDCDASIQATCSSSNTYFGDDILEENGRISMASMNTSTASDISSAYSALEDSMQSQTSDSECSTDDYSCNVSIEATCSSSTVYFGMVPITDNFGDNILEENGRISLAYENLQLIPNRLAKRFAAKTKCFDLSYNNFQNLSFLMFFNELHTLVLDRNTNLDVSTVPFLPKLEILWINNCEISNLMDWLYRVQDLCPRLKQLSMMGNPGEGSLSLLNGHHSDIDYQEHVFDMLPGLKYLNGVARTPSAECSQLSVISTVKTRGVKSIRKKR